MIKLTFSLLLFLFIISCGSSESVDNSEYPDNTTNANNNITLDKLKETNYSSEEQSKNGCSEAALPGCQ